MERDRSKHERLVDLGWDVRIIWECEVGSKDAESIMGVLLKNLES